MLFFYECGLKSDITTEEKSVVFQVIGAVASVEDKIWSELARFCTKLTIFLPGGLLDKN